jgi:plastocyanin
MATATIASPRRFARRPLAALGKATIAALTGITLAVGYIVVMIFGSADPMAITFAALPLVAAALMLTGWRWTPLVGALIGGLLLFMLAPGMPFILGQAGSPMQPPLLIIAALSLVAVVAGISATVQNYRHAPVERRTPRLLPYSVVALLSLVAGAISLAAVPQPSVDAGIDPAALAGVPTLGVQDFAFTEPVIRVKAGETVTLRLDNADPDMHYLDIDEFNIHAPIPAGKTGIAIFKPTEPGTYTFYCAPHYNKATGEGMKGTLIVAP